MQQAGRNSAMVDVVVIGGGMAGLAAADALASRGRVVRLIEASEGVGGLVRSISVGGEDVEAYYHHVFPQDRELRQLIDRLGLAGQFDWHPASTAVLDHGRVYPFDSPLDLMRFRPLPMSSRIRLGLGAAMVMVRGRGKRMDSMTVGEAGPRWFGSKGYAVLWRPLMEGKFGPYAGDVSLSWLVSRMKQRANARKRGTGDRLGYLRGGLGTLAKRYEEAIAAKGVRVSHRTPVESLALYGGRWRVRAGSHEVMARAVVACLGGRLLAAMTALPEPYVRSIEKIPYRGVVCILLELDRPLSRYYWVNLVDRTELACLAVIEHTNLVPAEWYGGRHLVYLPHYVEVGGRAWSAGEEEILDSMETSLRAINPGFDRSWVQASHVTRDRWAQPVPLAGGPMRSLPIETGLPGLFHASLAHIYPDDRGVSLALRLGQSAAAKADAWLTRADLSAAIGGELSPGGR